MEPNRILLITNETGPLQTAILRTAELRNIEVVSATSLSACAHFTLVDGAADDCENFSLIIVGEILSSPFTCALGDDETFLQEEVTAHLWAALYTTKTKVVNRPSTVGLFGRLSGMPSVDEALSPSPGRKEGYLTSRYLAQSESDIWLESWETGLTGSFVQMREKKGVGPYRYRTAVPGVGYSTTYVVGAATWEEGHKSDPSDAAHANSVSFAQACGLDFCRIIWARDKSDKYWPLALEPFPQLPQDPEVAEHIVNALIRITL